MASSTQKRRMTGGTRSNALKVLMKKWGGKCALCGKHVVRNEGNHRVQHFHATIEHLVPLAQGGSNKYSNLVLACNQCNKAHARLFDEQFKKMKCESC